MKIKTILALLFFVMLACGSATTNVSAQNNPNKEEKPSKVEKDDDDGEDEKLSAEDRRRVKITIEQARKTALERIGGGTVVQEELEKERGKLHYSFDIKDKNGKMHDVEVDAETGAIFKVDEEDGDDKDDDGDEKGTKPPR